MTFLLDVNVLIALIDPGHVGHDVAHDWIEREGRHDWATCPMTQNGVISALVEHRFWPDSVDMFDTDQLDTGEIRTYGQVTDSYLVALAAFRGGRLATLDRKLPVSAVRDGRTALLVFDGEHD